MATRRNRARKPVNRSGGETDEHRDLAREEKRPVTSGGSKSNRDAGSAFSREEERRRTMSEALRLLAARPRSESQMRELLLKKSAQSDVVDYCIARLKQLGYLDDRLFAKNYASYRVRNKPLGRSRLARELARKKVPGSAIQEALDSAFEEVDEESMIDRAIEKRIRVQGVPSDRRSTRRLFDHLARLGFEYDLIHRKLRALETKFEE